jgi:hypothetical protein
LYVGLFKLRVSVKIDSSLRADFLKKAQCKEWDLTLQITEWKGEEERATAGA